MSMRIVPDPQWEEFKWVFSISMIVLAVLIAFLIKTQVDLKNIRALQMEIKREIRQLEFNHKGV